MSDTPINNVKEKLDAGLTMIFDDFPEITTIEIGFDHGEYLSSSQRRELVIDYDNINVIWEDDAGDEYSYLDTDEHHDLAKVRRIINEITELIEDLDHKNALFDVFSKFPSGTIEITYDGRQLHYKR